ncbi:TerB family tellurite resistance protein [Vibrio harveyi]
MLDILDVINEATKEANSFENHAAKDLTLEERLLYLQGLALVMNADGEIHPEEKEYIRILSKSFEMDESILESFVEFAQRPDKDTVQAFFRTFRRRPIAQLFLFDALMMTRRDDSVDEREKAVVDKIAEQLEVLKGTYQDIYDLFCHIKNKDWEESALYFSSHLLNPEHFKHLLDYFEVDFDNLMLSSEKLQEKRFKQVILSKLNVENYEWEELKYYCDDIITTPNSKVTSHYVDLTSSLMSLVELIVPKVQSDLDRGKICVNPNEELESENGEILASVKSLGLNYDKENKCFNLHLSDDDAKKDEEIYSIACYLSTGFVGRSNNINDIIAFILQDENASIAQARRHPSYPDERCFPRSGNEYLDEVLEFEGKLYLNEFNKSYVHYAKFFECIESNFSVLKSGKIRIATF